MTHQQILEDAVKDCNRILKRWEDFNKKENQFSADIKSLLLSCLARAIRHNKDYREWSKIVRFGTPLVHVVNYRIAGLGFGIYRGDDSWDKAAKQIDYQALSDVPLISTEEFSLERIKAIKFQ